MIKVGIIGGTGYTGAELLRLLVAHPNVELTVITSRGEAGKPVADLFPSLRGHIDLAFTEPDSAALAANDVVFSATPNGIAMTHAEELVSSGAKLIDLAADFRIKDVALWEHWYGMTHACADLVEKAVYGMPEINQDVISSADIVANPGCYPTASLLALLPAVEQGLVDVSDLVVDAKSGVTGAGRGASVATLFSEVSDSFKAYAASGHRHHPEISQILQGKNSKTVGLTFIPHLVPMLRGIHATAYANLVDADGRLQDIWTAYDQYYQNAPFVDVLPLGAHPETRSVKSSNMCRIALHKAEGSGKLVILSVIDNLTKGAAGQAIHNMNIMFDLPQETGLLGAGLLP